MAIDIFNIPENVISKDLKSRFICIYGPGDSDPYFVVKNWNPEMGIRAEVNI